LVKNFPDVLNYKFNANVENDFDEIAAGKIEWFTMIRNFYEPFYDKVKLAKDSKDSANGERILGKDKKGKTIIVRIGRYGPLVQLGSTQDGDKKEDIKFGKIPEGQSIETLTLDDALNILAWPKLLGQHKGTDVVTNTGKYGPYVKWDNKFFSITQDPAKVTLEEAIEAIKAKESGGGGKAAIKEFDGGKIKVLDGKFGPYISVAASGKSKKSSNYKIPAEYTPSSLTKEDCNNIIEGIKAAPKKKFVKRKK
jgi:DNA topoisomerase-1